MPVADRLSTEYLNYLKPPNPEHDGRLLHPRVATEQRGGPVTVWMEIGPAIDASAGA